eukprot:139308_1
MYTSRCVYYALSLLSILQCVTSNDICPQDLYGNLTAHNLQEAWFHSIATTTTYDHDWPSWSAVPEQHAYGNISVYLSEIGNEGSNADIRSLYGEFDSTILNSIKTSLATMAINKNKKPTNCDDTCWDVVTTQLTTELTSLIVLSDFRDNIHQFLTDSNIAFLAEITVVSNFLFNEPESVSIVVGGGSDTAAAWSTSFGVINAFVGLFSIAAPEFSAGLKVFSWVVMATKTIGSAVIASQQTGHVYNVNVNLENALWNSIAHFTEQVQDTFDTEESQLNLDESAIASNYGKLQQYLACDLKLNKGLTKAGVSFESMVSEGIEQAKPAMQLAAFKAMMPAKYVYDVQFQCTSNMYECVQKTSSPSCAWATIGEYARSNPYAHPVMLEDQTVGWWLGFMQANGASDSSPITEDAVNLFNAALQSVTDKDNYSLQSIMTWNPKTDPTTTSFASYLQYSFSDAPTLAFSFNISVNTNWCDWECELSDGQTLQCGVCLQCTTQCGNQCNSAETETEKSDAFVYTEVNLYIYLSFSMMVCFVF